MRITILPLAFSISAIVFFSNCTSAYAAQDLIGKSQLHPAHPLYFLKPVREALEMHFAQTPRVKMIRSLEFATRRLREVKSLIDVKREDLIEPNMGKYWYHLQKLPDKDLEDGELVAFIKETTPVHLEVLENVYNVVENKRAKMAIRAALNRLSQRSDLEVKTKKSICDFLAKESTSSALNQTERVVLSERAESCFKSLRHL